MVLVGLDGQGLIPQPAGRIEACLFKRAAVKRSEDHLPGREDLLGGHLSLGKTVQAAEVRLGEFLLESAAPARLMQEVTEAPWYGRGDSVYFLRQGCRHCRFY